MDENFHKPFQLEPTQKGSAPFRVTLKPYAFNTTERVSIEVLSSMSFAMVGGQYVQLMRSTSVISIVHVESRQSKRTDC